MCDSDPFDPLIANYTRQLPTRFPDTIADSIICSNPSFEKQFLSLSWNSSYALQSNCDPYKLLLYCYMISYPFRIIESFILLIFS
jgi:hypothetical protein